jgi:hypothetical protein
MSNEQRIRLEIGGETDGGGDSGGTSSDVVADGTESSSQQQPVDPAGDDSAPGGGEGSFTEDDAREALGVPQDIAVGAGLVRAAAGTHEGDIGPAEVWRFISGEYERDGYF